MRGQLTNLITDARGLVKEAHDPYWDAPITRREVQKAVNDLCMNQNELTNMIDTANIVLNFLCEKLGVTRADLDKYVEEGQIKVAAMRKALEDKQRAQSDS